MVLIPSNRVEKPLCEDKCTCVAQKRSIHTKRRKSCDNAKLSIIFILNACTDIAESWLNLEKVEHWHLLFSGTSISEQIAMGTILDNFGFRNIDNSIAKFREPITDISRYLRTGNVATVRQVNAGVLALVDFKERDSKAKYSRIEIYKACLK